MLDAPRLAVLLFTLQVLAMAAGPTVGAGHFGATVAGFFWLFFAQPTGPLGVRKTLRVWPVPPLSLALAFTDPQALVGLHTLVAGLIALILGGLMGIATLPQGGRLHRALWPANPDLMGDFQRHTAQLMRDVQLEPFDLVVDIERQAHRIDVRPSHKDTEPTLARMRAVCAPAERWLAEALERWSFSDQDPFLAKRVTGTGSIERFSVVVPHIPENAHAMLQRLARTRPS